MIKNLYIIYALILGAIFVSSISSVQILSSTQITAAYTCNDGTEFPDPPRNFPQEDRDAIIESNCADHDGFGAAAPGDECNLSESFLALPTWYKYLETERDATGRCNPRVADSQAALPIGIAVLEGFIRVAGIVAVVMIFISGFKFITSQGNPESAKGARETAINALIGLVIVIVATSVVSFIGRSIV